MIRGWFNREQRRTVDLFRRTFTDTPTGRRCLTRILNDLRYFDDINTEEDRIRHNVGVYLLEQCGIYHDVHAVELVNGWADLPVDPHIRDDNARGKDPRREG